MINKFIKLPMPNYISLVELADRWQCSKDNIITYGATGKLAICARVVSLKGIWGELAEEENLLQVIPEKEGYYSGYIKLTKYIVQEIEVNGINKSILFELGNGDYIKLEKEIEIIIDQLVVTKEEIERFEGVVFNKSQKSVKNPSGRPNSMNYIKEEMENRAKQGKLRSTITEEARELEEWYKQKCEALKKEGVERKAVIFQSIVTQLGTYFKELKRNIQNN